MKKLVLAAVVWMLVMAEWTSPLFGADIVRVYLGTYSRNGSEGIYTCLLDRDTGQLSNLKLAAKARHPSFLALHPGGQVLFAVSEVADIDGQPGGQVLSFRRDGDDGRLSRINACSSRGAAPCHVAVDATGRFVAAANYSGGSVVVLPVDDDGRLGAATGFVQHEGGSVHRRQLVPHAHCVRFGPDERRLYVADLGLDQVKIYQLADDGRISPNRPAAAELAPGAGPRHFRFHPNGRFAYVINELQCTVTAFDHEADTGRLRARQTVSTLPAQEIPGSSTAEVCVTPDGKFLYGSNRGHDSLACFSIDPQTGELAFRARYPSGGRTPRNFNIDPSGKFLVAANQGTNNVVVMRIGQDGQLTPTGSQLTVGAPVCVLFADP